VSAQVTALLVINNEPASALRALAAIQAQTLQPTRLVIIDSSEVQAPLPVASQSISPKAKLGQIIQAGLDGLPNEPNHWLWLVHDDSTPAPTALAELVSATENSENIAQVGALQLSTTRSREITQLGLTLSNFGEIINPVRGQRDQSQHDQVKDVLAVGTSSMLVRTDAYLLVGGLDDRSATLAADIDLSMRLRRHGFRVVVAPRAKVEHQGLTLSGKRGRKWIGGDTKTGIRKATIQLRLVHDPLPLAILFWLALPALTLYRMFWRLAQKRPSFLWAELRAGLWGFLTIFRRLASRSNSGKVPTSSLSSLRATRAEVSQHKREAVEAEESAQSLLAFERGDHEQEAAEQSKNFTKSSGWSFMVILLALSWQQLPFQAAVTGGSAIPLSHDWFAIFARAGASWQPIGQGFVAPSDPFNWVLLSLSSLTFWSPNLSLVILLWLARALAFASAWRMLSLLTSKAWQKNLGAFIYAVLPAYSLAIGAGDFATIVAVILTPWLVFAVARAAGLGRSGSARSNARTWSWVGLAGVLLAAVGAAAPTLIILTLVGLGFVAFTKIRRFGYLFWIPLPLAAIYLPLVLFHIGEPLALLAHPAHTSGSEESLPVWSIWAMGLILVVAVAALLTKRWVVSLGIAGFALAAYVLQLFVQSLHLPEGISGSTRALEMALFLAVISLATHFGAQLKSRLALVATAAVLLVGVSPLAYLAFSLPNQTLASDGSVVPLLLQKQAEQGTDLQLLAINLKDDSYQVQWQPIGGLHLEDHNLAYSFSARNTTKDATYLALSQEVGNLVSANGLANAQVLRDNLIGYILVPTGNQNAGIVASLESSSLLESAGLTPFGELWRVVGLSASDVPHTSHNPWSITKVVQLSTLLGFALLAIPSRGRARRPSDSVIFIDQSESELDV
jgi:GT2 family glycosyltransferase